MPKSGIERGRMERGKDVNYTEIVTCVLLGVLCLCLIAGFCCFYHERRKSRERRRNERRRTENHPSNFHGETFIRGYSPRSAQFHDFRCTGTGCGNTDININRGMMNPVFTGEDRQPMQHSNDAADESSTNEVDTSLTQSFHTRMPQDSQQQTPAEIDSISENELFGSNQRQIMFPPTLQDLGVVSDRSTTLTVADKLVVFVTHNIDHKGDILYLDNMGISLQVPPGAVKRGEKKRITLLLNWDLGDNPYMSNRQALVSPVVFVGPHGLQLEKACILTYKHCSFDARHVQVMKSETDLVGEKNWEIMCAPEDTSGACVITPDECQLKINTFTLYTCLQQAPEDQTGGKWVQIAVFSRSLRTSVCHQQVRIYFLNKTNCALQWAIHNESRFGGRLICPEKLFLLYGSEDDMIISLTYLCEGWDIIDGKCERIPFFQVWHGKCPHVCMCLKKRSLNVHELNFSMEVFQEKRENQMERLVVQAIEDRYTTNDDNNGADTCSKHKVTIHCQREFPSKVKVEQTTNPVNDNVLQVEIVGPNSEIFPELVGDKRLIPENVRVRLKLLLDVQNPIAMNWKNLAERLGCDHYIPYLESKVSSPTEFLLGVAENKRYTVRQLMDMLNDMGRCDAAEVLQDSIDTERKTYREPVENDLNDDGAYKPNI